jgi:hypothetical protein
VLYRKGGTYGCSVNEGKYGCGDGGRRDGERHCKQEIVSRIFSIEEKNRVRHEMTKAKRRLHCITIEIIVRGGVSGG